MKPKIIQSTDHLVLEDAGKGQFNAVITNRQEITDEFLQELQDVRDVYGNPFRKTPDMRLSVSLPTGVYDHWKRQGFDALAQGVTIKDIKARLLAEDLGAFIVS